MHNTAWWTANKWTRMLNISAYIVPKLQRLKPNNFTNITYLMYSSTQNQISLSKICCLSKFSYNKYENFVQKLCIQLFISFYVNIKTQCTIANLHNISTSWIINQRNGSMKTFIVYLFLFPYFKRKCSVVVFNTTSYFCVWYSISPATRLSITQIL